MPRPLSLLFGLVVAGLLFGGPWAYHHYLQKNYRNFHTVRPGVLYRAGQLSIPGLKRVVHDHGIRTVISLRDTLDAPDTEEEAFCDKEGIIFVRLPPRVWWPDP